MHLRAYDAADGQALPRLFYDTVHTVCAKDYTPAQLNAWAPPQPDPSAWDAALRGGTTLVAEENGVILGFGTIRADGYLDLLYVQKDHQGRGVGNILCDFLEGLYPVTIVTVHASKTARAFFEGRGYRLLHPRQAVRRGETLVNYVMELEVG